MAQKNWSAPGVYRYPRSEEQKVRHYGRQGRGKKEEKRSDTVVAVRRTVKCADQDRSREDGVCLV